MTGPGTVWGWGGGGGDGPGHRGDSEAVSRVALPQGCSRPTCWCGPSLDPNPDPPTPFPRISCLLLEGVGTGQGTQMLPAKVGQGVYLTSPASSPSPLDAATLTLTL